VCLFLIEYAENNRYFFGCKDMLLHFYSETDFSFFLKKKGVGFSNAFSFACLLFFKDLWSKTNSIWNR